MFLSKRLYKRSNFASSTVTGPAHWWRKYFYNFASYVSSVMFSRFSGSFETSVTELMFIILA